MTPKLEKIQRDIETFGPEELAPFRSWFAAFDAANWDAGIEADTEAGRLDVIGEKALAAHRDGRTRPL